jgi:hypothetical protein
VKKRALVRTGLSAAATVVALAIVVPVSVALATFAGLEPRHWTGVALVGLELPGVRPDIVVPPESASILLHSAAVQDDHDTGDLAPSYWDANSGQVVLAAVTDAGVAERRNLGESSGTPYRIEFRPNSARELYATMHAAVPTSDRSAHMSKVDAERNRVVLHVDRLGHPLFAELARGFGGEKVAVVAAPFAPLVYIGERPADEPSWWSRSDPPGTWLTLATGFPWYLASSMAVAALFWLMLLLRRHQPDVARQLSASSGQTT